MDGCPLGLGLVVEDKPTEFSCIHTNNEHVDDISLYTHIHSPTHIHPFRYSGFLIGVISVGLGQARPSYARDLIMLIKLSTNSDHSL